MQRSPKPRDHSHAFLHRPATRHLGCVIGRRAGALFVAMALIVGVFVPRSAQAEPGRDFIVSCTYGVLAGTLVGAATLAFTDQPGQNLNKVARGASLGLYAGILLGLYVVYGGPTEDEDAAASLNRVSRDPSVSIFPLLGSRGLEGAGAQVKVLSF